MHFKSLTVLPVILITLFSINIQPVKADNNLIQNGSFEKINGKYAEGWSTDLFVPSNTEFKLETANPHSGKYCFSINNKKANDARIFQSVKIIPGKTYRIQFWYKTYKINKYGPKLTLNYSGYDSVFDSDYLEDTNNKWKKFEVYIKTKTNTPVIINPWFRLGGFSNSNTGKVYFDDIVFSPASEIPAGSDVYECSDIKPESLDVSADQPDKNSNSSGSSLSRVLIIAGIIIISGIMVAELLPAKNARRQPAQTIEVKDEDE